MNEILAIKSANADIVCMNEKGLFLGTYKGTNILHRTGSI